jgi:hypothetical protein
MNHITQNGASFSPGFVKGFKNSGAFIKAMEGNIPDWTGEERDKRLKSIWNEANGKSEDPVKEEIQDIQKI